MGDPKRIRKKYETPSHPWIKARIDEERRVRQKYSTTNKKEIWKMESVLKNFKTRAKNLIVLDTPQSKIETQQLFKRVQDLGLLHQATFDDILGLSLDDLMDRRLQTVVFKKGLARSIKQARQFIVHEHILVDGKIITSPNYLVKVKEEAGLGFSTSSALFSEQHPERSSSSADDESHDLSDEDNSKKAKAMSKTKKSVSIEPSVQAKKDNNSQKDTSKKGDSKEVDSKEVKKSDEKTSTVSKEKSPAQEDTSKKDELKVEDEPKVGDDSKQDDSQKVQTQQEAESKDEDASPQESSNEESEDTQKEESKK